MADTGKGKECEHNEKRHVNSEVSLVPLYSPLDVSRGLQAFRRGDVILYTVRGKPDKVHELIEELDKKGVNDVVALISHRTDGKDIEEVAEAIIEEEEKDH